MLSSILIVAALSFLLKIAPHLIPIPVDQTSTVSKGLDLTVCVMTGQIIMDTAVGGKSLSMLGASFSTYDMAALLAAAASYFTCRLTGSLIKGLIAGLVIFLVTVGVFL
jgi:branched-subunit amino acid transport protein